MRQSLLTTMALIFSLLVWPLGAQAVPESQKLSLPELQKMLEAQTPSNVIVSPRHDQSLPQASMVADTSILSTCETSNLRLDAQGKAYYRRDNWDVVAELYEKLPLVGGLVRFLKQRMS
jgi:hypothetical protein